MTVSPRFRHLALVLALLALPSAARAGKTYGFQMWAATTYVAPLSQTDQNVNGITAAVRASNEMGYEFGAELRSGLIGLQFDYLHAKQDLEHDNAGLLGTAEFNPVSATLKLHLPTPILELSAGPTVSYINWGDLDLRNGGTQKLDAKLGYGITVGADLPLGRSLAITSGMRWLKADAKPDGGNDIAIDPLITKVGVALRF